MRYAWVALTLFLLPGAVAQSSSWASLFYPFDFDELVPGRPETVDAAILLDIPSSSTCRGPVPWSMQLATPDPNATVTVSPDTGLVATVQPGQQAQAAIRVTLSAAANAGAYEPLRVQFRVAAGPCGDLDATSTLYQFSHLVGFHPAADIRVASQNDQAWTLTVASLANAPQRMTWKVLQPELGRVVATGTLNLTWPGSTPITLEIPKAGFDGGSRAVLNTTLTYGGNRSLSSEPPRAFSTLTLHEPRSTSLNPVLWAGVAGLTIGLGVLLWVFLRRGR